MGRWALFALLALLATSQPALADCFERHGARYGIAPDLLRAIAHVESAGRPHAVNNSHAQRTRTRDLGLMQINTGWLPRLARYGIQERDLFDGCTSIEIGAWVLHDLIQRHGNTWDAVGAYNAACTELRGNDCIAARAKYAWRVYRRLQSASSATAPPSVPTSTGVAAGATTIAPAARAPGLISAASSRATTRKPASQDPEPTDAPASAKHAQAKQATREAEEGDS